MGLNENQKQAVEYLNGPLLVLAGPGTGKTQLLSHRVKYILEATDTNPENILCLTFTDTGAANMRERLKSIIGPAGAKVHVGTYHAFGSEVLAQYKNYNEDYDRRLDSSLDEVTQHKIIKMLQEALPGTDILRGDRIRDIKDTISDAKKARLTPEDLMKIAEQNAEESAKLSAEISLLLKNVIPRKYQESLDAAYVPISELLEEYLNAPVILPGVARIGTILAESLKEALEQAAEKNSVKPLSDWKDDNFEQDKHGNYRLKNGVANKKLKSFARLMQRYEDHLEENALFDYDDMIEEAALALTNDDGFRMTLQERYQYIMLDEFQDTNPSQFAIVKALTNYENPIIMAVGDDDQAIYEFQGALASNMKDFLDYYNAKMIPLVENYRSTQEILDFASKIIAKATDKKFGVKKLIANVPAPKSTQIFRYEFGAADAEYGFIASKINELVESGVSQKQIAVLTRKNKYFEPLLPYLKDYEAIKIAYEKRDNLFEDEKIHQVLTIAQFAWEIMNEQKPTVQVMEILTYKFFGTSPIEVAKLNAAARREHRGILDYVAEHGSEKIQEAVGFLEEIARKCFTEPLENILFEIAKKMQPEKMDEYERFSFYENLASLKGKLKNHFGEKKLRLGDLVEMANDYMDAELPLNTTSPYKDADEAVRLMTVHGAKGLEFEYVFVLSADNKAWGKAKGNNNFLVLPKNLQQIRHTGTTDSERLRVMYVALTRAKHTLIITNSVRDFTGTAPARLEYFDEYVDKLEDGSEVVVAPLIPSGRVNQMALSNDLATRESNVKNWVTVNFVKDPDLKALFREQMVGYRMSASALATFMDLTYSGPKSFYDSYVLKTQREPEDEKIVLGNVMHKTLEEVTRQGLSDEQAAEKFIEELEKYDTTTKIRDDVRDKGLESLRLTLEEFGEIIRNGKAEIDFSADNIVVDGVPIRGVIDHLVIDDKNKTIEVYDYKTGTYYSDRWTSKPSLLKYALQLEFYKLLLNNSRRYRDYRVARGHILFVLGDDNDEVYDKVYEFEDKIRFYNRKKVDLEVDFKELVKAVYRQMTTLNFVDDEALFLEADKSRNMTQIREFIKLLLAKSAEK